MTLWLYVYLFGPEPGPPSLAALLLALARLALLIERQAPDDDVRTAAASLGASAGALAESLGPTRAPTSTAPTLTPLEALQALPWVADQVDLVEHQQQRRIIGWADTAWLVSTLQVKLAPFAPLVPLDDPDDPARRPTDPAPPPVSGEVPCG